MPVYRRVWEGYKKPTKQGWVCWKKNCRYYKKGIPDYNRGKYTGCNKYINTWDCPKFYSKEGYK